MCTLILEGDGVLNINTIEGQLITMFAATQNIHVPSQYTDLLESGTLDSLSFVAVILHLEQEYGIEVSIDDLEIENFRSVEKMAKFVVGQLSFSSR